MSGFERLDAAMGTRTTKGRRQWPQRRACAIGATTIGLLVTTGTALAQTAEIAVGRAMWVVAPFPTLDVTADVGQLCNGKSSCQFVVSPSTFGGKSPQGTGRHQLIVQYKCGTATKNGLGYDAESLALSCP